MASIVFAARPGSIRQIAPRNTPQHPEWREFGAPRPEGIMGGSGGKSAPEHVALPVETSKPKAKQAEAPKDPFPYNGGRDTR
ncbi:MAG: hypothetical protein WC759_02640 [Candidatus Micrarchaeia archaeon]